MRFTHSIAAIRKQIALQAEVLSIRAAVLNLLRHSIEQRKHTLQDKENEHFSNAITALTMNMQAARQPSYSWLRLCLVDLEKAIGSNVPNDGHRHAPNGSVSGAKYAILMNAVTALERELNGALVHSGQPPDHFRSMQA